MYGVLEAHNLEVLNTHDKWYKVTDESASEHDRWTWEGVVFDHRMQASIDYTICDAETFYMAELARVVSEKGSRVPLRAQGDHHEVQVPRAVRPPHAPLCQETDWMAAGWRRRRLWGSHVPDVRPPRELTMTQIASKLHLAAMQTGTAHPRRGQRDGTPPKTRSER